MSLKRYSILVLSIVLLITAIFTAVPGISLAATAGAKPLSFVGSYPGDGATGVSRYITKITLVFDKNVVNDAVWSNNRYCFVLKRGTTVIPVTVTRIKDTVDFSQRRKVFLVLKAPLAAHTRYSIYMSPNLRAKNGVSTLGGTTYGRGRTIFFTTR